MLRKMKDENWAMEQMQGCIDGELFFIYYFFFSFNIPCLSSMNSSVFSMLILSCHSSIYCSLPLLYKHSYLFTIYSSLSLLY